MPLHGFAHVDETKGGTRKCPSENRAQNVILYRDFADIVCRISVTVLAKAFDPAAITTRRGDGERKLKTGWRWRQSPANPSPAQIPGNREKYREFHPICRFESRPAPLEPTSRATLRPCIPSSRAKRNRELIWAYQGIYWEEQGISSPRFFGVAASSLPERSGAKKRTSRHANEHVARQR